MSNVMITESEISETEMLRDVLISAFKEYFEKYGHYPPGIESIEWHQVWWMAGSIVQY